MPKVTVITTTYNRAKTLKKTIQSVLNQSFKDFEYIIVNDASNDDTKKVLNNILDERVRVINREENFGHDGRPKNEGILHAKGDYVTFLDDDDIYYEDALKILYKYAIHTDADVIYGDYLNNIGGKKKPGWSLHFDVQTLTRMNYISMCVAMVKRKSVVAVGGFDENIPQFKDWNLWLRMQKNNAAFVHVPIFITEVFHHGDSISEKNPLEMQEGGGYKPKHFNPADCKIYAEKTIFGEKPPLKAAIFTLTLDRLEYTKKMYEAMNRTAGYNFDWFVLDQGSKDSTREWLYEKAITILEDKNIGIAKGWDRLIEKIRATDKYDVVVKLDNDAEMLTKGWLKDMIDIFERNRRVILSPYVEGLDSLPGGVLRQRQDGSSPYILINDRVFGLVPNLGGICFASPIELYDGFKFPDDLKGNKDYYLSKYAQQQGYALMYMEEYRVAHMEGTDGQHKRYPDYFKKLYNV